MEPGQRLPSEPALAEKLGVSRATLREAMRIFETQGMIRRKQGSGTYITRASNVFETGLEILESLETQAERVGLEVKMGDYKLEHRAATEEECQALSLTGGCEVTAVTRVIHAEDRPVAYLIDVLPVDVLGQEELEREFTGSVLDMLLKRGAPHLTSARTEITAVTASATVARAMGIQRGDVLLGFIAYLYSDSGRVVDFTHSYFLPGYFRFHVMRRIGLSAGLSRQ